jgi:hypothetical protein
VQVHVDDRRPLDWRPLGGKGEHIQRNGGDGYYSGRTHTISLHPVFVTA